MDEREKHIRLEKAMKAFWKDYGQSVSINARHTYVNVEPKFIVGNKINEEVAKRILGVYLSQLTSDKIVGEEILITKDGLKIYHEGNFLMEITNQKLIDSISNRVTHKLGEELAKKQKKDGSAYIEQKERAVYTFGEIKQALSEFMLDQEKNDSKNMLKDAVMLLVE